MGERGPKPHTWEVCIENIQDRSYLKEDTRCFIYMGGHIAGQLGYGYIRCDGKSYYIHRLIYERMICSEVPEVVMHTCDNPKCWNPKHLEGGTHQDNVNDKMQKGRYRGPYGATSMHSRCQTVTP